jgi:hypothetical protein
LLGNWNISLNPYFILTDMQGPFVRTLFRIEALLRYRSNYETWDPKTPLAWELLRAAMREHFATPNEDRRRQVEWANLRQQTAFEYVNVDGSGNANP